jgi:hypothetical protein
MHDETDSALENWLLQINSLYQSEEEPMRARPMRAIQAYAQQFPCTLEQRIAANRKIFKFFEDRSPPGTFSMGSIYKGCFFYESYFWPLHVPIMFGEVNVSSYDTLPSMPQSLKEEIRSNLKQHIALALHCADCMDYGYGFEEAISNMSQEAVGMLKGAATELDGAMTLIENNGGNSRTMLSLRLATEMFLKSFLIQESKLDENGLKRFGHHLGKLSEACLQVGHANIFEILLKSHESIFPKIDSRYEAGQFEPMQVWKAAVVSQGISAAVIRKYSTKNLREEAQKKIIAFMDAQKAR